MVDDSHWKHRGYTYGNGFAQERVVLIASLGGFDIEINPGRRCNLYTKMMLFGVIGADRTRGCRQSRQLVGYIHAIAGTRSDQ